MASPAPSINKPGTSLEMISLLLSTPSPPPQPWPAQQRIDRAASKELQRLRAKGLSANHSGPQFRQAAIQVALHQADAGAPETDRCQPKCLHKGQIDHGQLQVRAKGRGTPAQEENP